jgi:hypothetical protein
MRGLTVVSTIALAFGIACTERRSANILSDVASADPIVRGFGERIYVVNRFGFDNISIVHAEVGDATIFAVAGDYVAAGVVTSISLPSLAVNAKTPRLIDQISTGAGNNAQDVAVLGNKLYVAALAARGVLVLDADRPAAGPVATIDLGELDPDGLPNCSSLYLAGKNLIVICGLLDQDNGFTPRGKAAVAVIDTRMDRLVTDYRLSYARPLGLLTRIENGPHKDELLIATVPDLTHPNTGCLERILPTGEPAGCLIEHEQLGGYASAYASLPDGSLAVSVITNFDPQDLGPRGFLARVDEGVPSYPISPPTERIFDLARCPGGEVAVSDAKRGVRVYNPDGSQLTNGPIDIGLPPGPNGLTCL